MKRQLLTVIVILALLFIAGGFAALFQGLEIVGQVFICFFPVFAPAFQQSFESYLTSPYFIVGIIMIILSSFGVYLSVKEKKLLFIIVSVVADIISIFSLVANLAKCA